MPLHRKTNAFHTHNSNGSVRASFACCSSLFRSPILNVPSEAGSMLADSSAGVTFVWSDFFNSFAEKLPSCSWYWYRLLLTEPPDFLTKIERCRSSSSVTTSSLWCSKYGTRKFWEIFFSVAHRNRYWTRSFRLQRCTNLNNSGGLLTRASLDIRAKRYCSCSFKVSTDFGTASGPLPSCNHMLTIFWAVVSIPSWSEWMGRYNQYTFANLYVNNNL